jgi:DNA-binding transcriptional regulator GbsR (MarR family)
MQTGATEFQQGTPELVPLNVIRVETSLSRYPVHRLAKQGTASIEIREKSETGDVVVQWRVSHNSEYGQPGPLAYKLDTLIVNRRIEEAARPIPKIIKLGSQAAIAEELGISTHNTSASIKKALYQNASAFIVAKLRYTLADGRKKELEAGFTRYSVVFTGEEIPDGRKADGVYLVLNDVFMQVINGAQTRPLDYDYLRDLPPASQRLYELLSFQMYAALKYGRPRARLSYAEFCTHAPLTRHEEWLRVRTQMNKLHAPHKKSGYIASVEFEQTTDRDGKPDWIMLYTPGPKARAEYRAFTKRGGPRILEIEQSPPALELVAHQVGSTPLERELITRGVTPSTAAELVAAHPEEKITAQVEHFDWLKEKHPKKITQSPGGFLVKSIREGYTTPPGFETKAARAVREEAKREQEQREADARRLKEEGRRREQEAQARIAAYLAGLTAQEQEQFDAEALEAAEPEIRTNYEQATNQMMRRLYQRLIRESHARRLLDIPEPTED